MSWSDNNQGFVMASLLNNQIRRLVHVIVVFAFIGVCCGALEAVEFEHPMFRAIRQRNDELLQHLLQRGTPLEIKSPDGTTPLIYAALHGSVDSVEKLLRRGANPNATTTRGVTPLIWASGDPAKVELLLEYGADVNCKTELGNSPLHVSVSRPGNGETISMLLAKGADLNAVNARGQRPLQRAIDCGDAGNVNVVIQALREAGQLESALKQRTSRLLTSASELANPEILHFLLDQLKSMKVAPPGLAWSTHRAMLYQRRENVQLLLEYGVDVNQRSGAGNVPLLTLATYTEVDDDALAKALLEHGANVDAVNDAGESAWTWAKRRGHTQLIATLLEANVPEVADPIRDIPNREIILGGANDQQPLRNAVKRSLTLMQHSSDTFLRERRSCVSCHHQDLPSVAFGWAMERGIRIDEQALASIFKRQSEIDKSRIQRAYQLENYVAVPPRQLGWRLWGLSALGYPQDQYIEASVWYLMQTQFPDGHWSAGLERPPMGGGDIVATTLALQAIQLYPLEFRREETQEVVAAAARWLQHVEPVTLQDHVFRVLGLSISGVPHENLADELNQILSLQRSDGGWAQLPNLSSDSWATGQTLTVLATTGLIQTTSRPYLRGLEFLLSTQFDDGSWFVKTRSWPFQTEFDSGFPFGHDQWISIGGTAWATMSMLLAIKPDSPSIVSRYGDATKMIDAKERQPQLEQNSKALSKRASRDVEFGRDIQPLLQKSCLGCHSGEIPEGGLNLTSRQTFLDGGESQEPAIIPGNAANSRLIKILTGSVEGLAMPPVDARAKFPALTSAEIAQFESWIDDGAPWPNGLRLSLPQP